MITKKIKKNKQMSQHLHHLCHQNMLCMRGKELSFLHIPMPFVEYNNPSPKSSLNVSVLFRKP